LSTQQKLIKSHLVFFGEEKKVRALNDFSIVIQEKPASITTIAGESGSGKTTIANLVLGFTSITSGRIKFLGKDLSEMSSEELFNYRKNVQAVFQDPFGVYNPFYKIRHIFDLVIKHFKLAATKSDATNLIEESLGVVGLKGDDVLDKFPHQLSGGQRQRMMMARAYMIKPRIIVADEPVSMVDASLRAGIIDVMLKMRDEDGINFLYITHDLATAYQIGNQIYILYRGDVVQSGDTVDVIDNPKHPYVQLLVDSVPPPFYDENWSKPVQMPEEDNN
jgi:peptide/nickel transport system ATP-binding protein